MQQILVTRGVVVDAETIEEALEKTKPAEGVTVSLNANPRPQPQQVPGRVVTGGFQQSTIATIPALPTPPTTS